MRTPKLFYEIVFMQGEEASEVLDLIENEGEGAAIDLLAQWDNGGESEHTPTIAPWGTSDNVFRSGHYVLSYNTRLGYAGLSRKAPKQPTI